MTPAATLVLFCRRPAAGVGKRRLAASIGDEATEVAAGLLLDAALEDASAWPGALVISPAGAGDAEWAAGLLDRPLQVIAQPAGNLGDRIAGIDARVRSAGAASVIFIGSDAPSLQPADYSAAQQALQDSDVVFIPATDGGVTLMGANQPWPDLHDLPWSSDTLGAALANACQAAGLRVAWLPARCDVDTASDLADLQTRLAGDGRPARTRLREWVAGQASLISTGAHDSGRSATLPAGLSIIIPVAGPEPGLERLLDQLASMPLPADEIIVADASATGEHAATCSRRGIRHLPTTAGRGSQQAAGAAAAGGRILWFLHADAQPHRDAAAAIRGAIAADAAGGCFRFRFAGQRRWPQQVLEHLINWRCRFGVPYGDQGLFASTAAYTAAGGFPAQPLFEEVPLVRGLRRTGRFVRVPLDIGVSPRRWERDGWLRRSLINRALAIGYMLGIPPGTLARHYRPMHETRSTRQC